MCKQSPTRRVDESIVSELMIGETSRWEVGLCSVRAERRVHGGCYEEIAGGLREKPDMIVVYGECRALTRLPVERGAEEITRKVNDAIRREYDAL